MKTMRHVQKRYLREFWPAIAAYVIVLFGSVWLLRNHGDSLGMAARSALSLLPMLPIALVSRAIVRVIRDSDELERRIDLEAAAVAGLAVGLSFFSLGLLASGKVIVLEGSAVAIWVFPALCGTYGIAKVWASRRFRG
jgi:hypothetical protein